MRQSRTRIRKRSAVAFALATAGALAVAGIALAAASSTSSFSFRCDGRAVNNACPKNTFTKGRLFIHTHTNYTNPGSPDGGKTKRIQIFFDNDFRFDPSVTPRCDPNAVAGVNMATAMANCGPSLIGSGTGQADQPGPSPFPACMLLFNGTNDANGDPRIILYFRAPVSDCSDPANNTAGSTTIVLPGSLRTTPIGDYSRELDIPNIHNVVLAVEDLNFSIRRDSATSSYVKARCFDANRVWNVTTRFTYNNNTTQTVNSPRTCTVG